MPAFFYWILPWIVRCGWAWLFFSLLASSHRLPSCQFISHSQPRQGGGLDFQKSKQIVVNRDHHFLSASKESILEVVGDYSTRRWCNVVCLALPIHLEHITQHKVHTVMATRSQDRGQIIGVDAQRKQLMSLKVSKRDAWYTLPGTF